MSVKNQLFLIACNNNNNPEVLRNLFNLSLGWADKDDRNLLFRLYLEACKG